MGVRFTELPPAQRARWIANTLLAELPDEIQKLYVCRAHALGETWLGSTLVEHSSDDVVSTAEAAGIAHVLPGTVRKWKAEGRLVAVSRGRYRVGDVIAAASRLT